MKTTRRHFLALSAFAGTSSLLSPFARSQGANRDLRVAVIGLRGRGKKHLSSVLSHPRARLVALGDVDTAQIAAAQAMLPADHPRVAPYTDYRRLCEDPAIDAVMIATCNHTHVLIALTAAAHGKHVYLEKPVSHNIWEGRKLVQGQQQYAVNITHGFQRRSEPSWQAAFAWLAEGHLGQVVLARGFCYKPRQSIGKLAAPVAPPDTVDYDLWSGPREPVPVQRSQFHYDWHWQSAYGNGDLGNQGPHQIDICRWALGDPPMLPHHTFSVGGRVGYDDDGDTPNTQLVWFQTAPAPILFEVRGLPRSNLDWSAGMDAYRGVGIGNVIEYEGGALVGGHDSRCRILDRQGTEIKRFHSDSDHIHTWVEAVLSGDQHPMHNAQNGHLSSAIAHLGGHSLALGRIAPQEEIAGQVSDQPVVAEAFDRMQRHLAANGLPHTRIGLGAALEIDPATERFTGPLASAATSHDREFYRAPFTLPNA